MRALRTTPRPRTNAFRRKRLYTPETCALLDLNDFTLRNIFDTYAREKANIFRRILKKVGAAANTFCAAPALHLPRPPLTRRARGHIPIS